MVGEGQSHMVEATTAPEPHHPLQPEGGAGDVILLTLPAKAEYIALCRLAVAALARVSGVQEETLADLKLAVTEACTYALQGQADIPDASVEVAFRVTTDRWVVDVDAPSAGPAAVGSPGEGDLGLMVMRALVDDVQVESPAGSRTSLRLTKRL